ncbi:MAG TPA: nucleoside monophosphate kinase [Candidatus Saccharimonadales bacterium]|nr:nucleoside monophosphate kinase [Candidatus Saccharimonadales bacterium]
MASVIIVHGPTKAGKSWQAQRLARRQGYAYLSSGDLLRSTKDPAILERHNTGHLARSEDVERIMEEAIGAVPADKGIVIDGFPRKLNEFRHLEQWLHKLHRDIQAVLEVHITPEESYARMDQRDRGDDHEVAIKRKWAWYQRDTAQVLDYCRSQGLLTVIDGIGTPEEVAARIEAAL